MDCQLQGKTAYVAAGAHGIGEAIADLLAQEGAVVLVSDRDADALRERAASGAGPLPRISPPPKGSSTRPST